METSQFICAMYLCIWLVITVYFSYIAEVGGVLYLMAEQYLHILLAKLYSSCTEAFENNMASCVETKRIEMSALKSFNSQLFSMSPIGKFHVSQRRIYHKTGKVQKFVWTIASSTYIKGKLLWNIEMRCDYETVKTDCGKWPSVINTSCHTSAQIYSTIFPLIWVLIGVVHRNQQTYPTPGGRNGYCCKTLISFPVCFVKHILSRCE